jgi:hypothetical protein
MGRLMARTHRSRRCSDSVCYLRYFCHADQTSGRRTLDRYCSLIPGLDVKLSAIVLAGSMVLSAVGLCALRMMGLGDVGGSMSKARCRQVASQSIGRSHHRQRPGRDVRPRAERELLLTTLYAGASFADQRKSVPSTHIRCRTTASLRARATLALRMPMRLTRRMPHALSADHFWTRLSNTPAAS